MTDWDLILTNIQNAMLSVDDTHRAAEDLRNNASHETLDDFRTNMEELHRHLTELKEILEHQSTYSMDELIDVLSRYYSGKPAAFRRTRRIES